MEIRKGSKVKVVAESPLWNRFTAVVQFVEDGENASALLIPKVKRPDGAGLSRLYWPVNELEVIN